MIKKNSQVLPIQFEKLRNFVIDNTKIFDESHNWEHADKVYKTTIEIANSFNIEYDEDIITYASMLHDVCDHKYPNSISRETLHNFIIDQLNETKANDIMNIIDNVSFSKEDKGLCKDLGQKLNVYLTWIRDADRLEAIGEIGIKRCTQFVIAIGGNVPQDVVQHCYDKLLRLYDEHFIRTEYARKLAEPLHEYIMQYVNNYVN
jgi:uncharacterized protein